MPITYYLFSLPPALLDVLVLRIVGTSAQQVIDHEQPKAADQQRKSSHSVINSGERGCNICPGAVYKSLVEQRTHFRSDWHRYNVKLKLAQRPPIPASDFTSLIESLDDSLSGSLSSSDNEDSSDSELDNVKTLLQRSTLQSIDEESEVESARPARTALSWFHAPPAIQLGIYNAIFSDRSSSSTYLTELKALQDGGPDGRFWAMFMIAGGHFAGLIVKVSTSPKTSNARSAANQAQSFEVIKHKTFHRYTTRRKQGGSQSTNDKTKGHASSAGAQLRRYGEQALQDDIRNLLNDWATDLEACDRIWFRASVSNRRILWDYDNAIIRKGDPRLRSFPFPTRRPTHSELIRCLNELTTTKVAHRTEEEMLEEDLAFVNAQIKAKPRRPTAVTVEAKAEEPPPKQPTLSQEQKKLGEDWDRAFAMIKKGRHEALRLFWEREQMVMGGVNALSPDWCESNPMTLLHAASSSGQVEITQWLLEEKHADPTIPLKRVDVLVETEIGDTTPLGRRGYVPYEVASTKDIRNVFRRMADAHPEWWDWFGAARVPSGLNAHMEEEREDKLKTRRKGLKDKVRDRLEKAKEAAGTPEDRTEDPINHHLEEEKSSGAVSNSNKLGGRSGDSRDLAGLNAGTQMKIERERRAREAEARMRGT